MRDVSPLSDDTVGRLVRAARERAGISLRSLAELIEASPATLSNIENGRTRIDDRRLGRIADALGTAVPNILDIDPDQPAPEPTSDDEPFDWRSYGPLDLDPVLVAALEEFVASGTTAPRYAALPIESGSRFPRCITTTPASQTCSSPF